MLAGDPDAFDALLAEIRRIEDAAVPDEPDVEEEEEEEALEEEPFEDEDEDEPTDTGPSPAPRYPKRQVKRAMDLHLDSQRNEHRADIEFQVRSSADRLLSVDVDELVELLAQEPNGDLQAAVVAVIGWADAARGATRPGP